MDDAEKVVGAPGRKLFGVALDASDDPWSLELKQAWMSRESAAPDEKADSLDPYDAMVEGLTGILRETHIKPAGKVPVPSWLQPRPKKSDLPLVNTRGIAQFYDSGGLKAIISQVEAFVSQEILPSVPVMVGVDHAATLGVISALAKKYAPEKLSVLALDQHFDAIPLEIRAATAAAATDGLSAVNQEQVNCGNFWPYLIDSGLVLPENLAFVGVADYPPGNEESGESSLFLRCYRSFEKRGCRFFPLERFSGPYRQDLGGFIREVVRTPLVYVSLDLDVGSYNFTWAARYMDRPGISAQNLLDIAAAIKGACIQQGAALAGVDIMEFNQHFLGIESEEGLRDTTLETVGRFIQAIF